MPVSISIIGGGIIGLSCAWEMVRRGASVNVHDKAALGRGASWAAAGMLAPAYETAIRQSGTHSGLHALCIEGAALWPQFAAELILATGRDLGYKPGPSLAIATEDVQAARLEELCGALSANGTAFRRLGPAEARKLEPSLTGNIQTALSLPTDGQVDNRAVLKALLLACRAAGVQFGAPPVQSDATLIATGWESAECSPVKGQLLSLGRITGAPERLIQSGHLYIVPKADRVVIGATSEMGLSDSMAETGATDSLLAKAAALCPVLSQASVLERWAGVRPMTPDGGPVLGSADNGNWVATGHYRNGILLAPITAKIMANMILGGPTLHLAEIFAPQRFAAATP